jgi:hypothetical protein
VGQPALMWTDSQEDQGFEVGEAGGTGAFRRLDPGRPGRVSSAREKGVYSRWVNPGNCVKAWESDETSGDKIQKAASSTLVDNRKGAMWLREGCAIPVRGRL